MPGIQSLTQLYPRPLDDTTWAARQCCRSRSCNTPRSSAIPRCLPQRRRSRVISFNSIISAPMIRQDKVFGAISAAHHQPRAFDGKEIALIKAFADQAVIAIENVRLFEAEQQRARELSESLEQQTATSEVLRLSAALPVIFSQYLQPCWRMPSASATPSLEISIAGMATPCTSWQRIIRRLRLLSIAGAQQCDPQGTLAA